MRPRLPADVKNALESISTIHEVDVQHAAGSVLTDLVCGAGGRTIEITFLTQRFTSSVGLSLDGVTISASEQVQGTKEDAICNNRGFCEDDPSSHWSGQCRCVDHRIVKFTSSDGKGETDGLMGDCKARYGYLYYFSLFLSLSPTLPRFHTRAIIFKLFTYTYKTQFEF